MSDKSEIQALDVALRRMISPDRALDLAKRDAAKVLATAARIRVDGSTSMADAYTRMAMRRVLETLADRLSYR